ncbi:MAG: NAD-dependent deacylase [Anaerolineaceae bacterium]|nr:MAG: NAD-dependent deacylase [Anaerolineaceae bacterium]
MLNEDVCERIRQAATIIGESRHLVAFTGAGISTDSGIPDFRSQNSGVWRDVDPLKVASIYGFRHDPQAFYDWVRPLSELMLSAEPNAAHHALADLETAGHLRSVITQNIDMLHSRAGHRQIFELHGHMRQATCIHCFAVCDGENVMRQFLSDGQVPRCPQCGSGILKPNVILFGEQLPFRELQGAQDAARDCDVMVVVGSSLEVAPADGIPLLAHRTGAKLIIVNLEPTPADRYADVVIHGRAAHILPEIIRYVEKSE